MTLTYDQISRLASFPQHIPQDISVGICFKGKEMFACLLSITGKTNVCTCPAVVLSQEQDSQAEKGACAQGSGLLTHPCLKKKRLHIEVLRPLQDGDCYSDSKQ